MCLIQTFIHDQGLNVIETYSKLITTDFMGSVDLWQPFTLTLGVSQTNCWRFAIFALELDISVLCSAIECQKKKRKQMQHNDSVQPRVLWTPKVHGYGIQSTNSTRTI